MDLSGGGARTARGSSRRLERGHATGQSSFRRSFAALRAHLPQADTASPEGGRPIAQGESPGIEPTTESIGALPRAPFSTSTARQREKKRPWQGGREWCGVAGPRALALGYESAALRAGLDAFGPRTRTGAAPVFGPRKSGQLAQLFCAEHSGLLTSSLRLLRR